MNYYLNELSIQFPCSENQEQGRILMEQFVNNCQQVEKIGYDKLRYSMKLRSICLATDYFVDTWLKDIDVEREYKTRFRSITTQTPFFDENDTNILVQQEKLTYFYRGDEAIGLGLAHLQQTLVVSFMTSEEWNRTIIDLEQWFVEDNLIKPVQIILHSSLPEHINSIKKTFEFHKEKHGICGKNAERNQSIMYCCTIEEAEKLLNTALSHPKKERWFCNYDKDNERFVVFLPHEEQRGNKYHGFHYENTPNTDPDRDLNNPQNGIPKFMQDKLKIRMS